MSGEENGFSLKREHHKTIVSTVRNLIFIVFVCLVSLLMINPITAQEGKKYGKLYLKEYKAKTADEAAILDILIQYEKSFNSHDLQGLLAFFAKDAIYRPCGVDSHYPVASQGCQNIIKYNFGSFKFETYYDPEMSVNGNEAVVKLLLETGVYLADYKFVFRKDGHAWLISKNDFSNDHLKD